MEYKASPAHETTTNVHSFKRMRQNREPEDYYYTFAKSYKCSCSDNNINNYCVFDPYQKIQDLKKKFTVIRDIRGTLHSESIELDPFGKNAEDTIQILKIHKIFKKIADDGLGRYFRKDG